MFQRDFILRMIEQFSKVLAKVLFNKEAKNYEVAHDEIRKSYKIIFGIDCEIISISSPDEILSLLKFGNKDNPEAIIMIAELIKEEVDINHCMGVGLEELVYQYQKALSLFLEAIIASPVHQTKEYYAKVDSIVDITKNYSSETKLMLKLLNYYEVRGNYTKAENVLFELTDLIPHEIKEVGIYFFEKLKSKSDEELLRGNFSRIEIEQGITEFLTRIEKYL